MLKENMKITLVLLFLSTLFFQLSNAQNITNKGREFWVGYGHHQYMEPSCNGMIAAPNNMNMVLYLSAEEPAIVTVTIDSSGPLPATWFRRTYFIPANTVISTENLPKGSVDAGPPSSTNPNYDARLFTDPPPAGSGGEGVFRRKGIHIESTVPIVAYAHIYGGVSSGATMLMPTTAWGYSYTSLNSEQRDADRSYSWMYVIAKENNTRIRITPSVISRLGKPANVPFEVLLQKGQIYQLIGESDCATGDGPELTGTRVISLAGPDGECHPVAVYSGSSRTGGETLTCGTGSGRDNDMQQLFPEQTWGKRYLTAPFSKSSGTTIYANQFQTSVYKVLVKDPTTVVRRNNVQLTGLIGGKYYKFSSNTTDSIIADKPIMVGQFMSGTSSCNGGGGDPEMVYLSPMEQAINRIGFFRNTLQAINANYLTLIVPTPGIPSLRIDGSSTFNHTYPHSTPGYTVVVKGWEAEQAQCIVTCDSSFTGITYGLGGAESYAYNAGTFLNNLSGVSDINNISDESNNGNNSHPYSCVGAPAKLSLLVRYQPTKLVWRLSELGTSLTPNADVTLDPASAAYQGTVTVKGILYHKYTLPDTYTFNNSGKFDVRILSTSPSLIENCNNTEDIYVGFEVKAAPSADFTYTNASGCVRDITSFFGPAATSISNIQQWAWSFPGGKGSKQKDTVFALTAAGDNVVSLKVVSNEGCIASVSKTITLLAPPTADFTFNPASVCEAGDVVFTPTASFTGAAPVVKYYWDFTDNVTRTTTTPDQQTYNFTTPGQKEVKFVAGTSNLCVSDTIKKMVTVYSKPVINITYPAGCLPVDGIVLFTNNTSTPDGQTLTSHTWNFGDAAATPANPNTSTAVSPSHVYTAFGNYDVAYSVTSSQGCIASTVIKATFNVSPQLIYPALSAVCENAAPFSVATASVTNGVPGTGVYSGPGTDAAGLFNPQVAGPGTHTITYTFTSTASCVVTQSQNIVVNAKPVASFTVPSGGCLPATGTVTFTNTSTIADAQTLSWLWNFGDAAATVTNPNTSTQFSPSHNFVDGTYSINLKVTSSAGCVHDTTVGSVFKVTPVVNFPALAPICESSAPLSIASATVTNAVPGTGIYSGPGVNAAGGFDPAIAGAGSKLITYTYTSTGGCTVSAAQTIVVYAKPSVSFDAPTAAGCLPSNGLVNFTNTSSISDGQTLSYLWNFNDPNATAGNPNTSTAFAPSHNFTDGTYNISLQATSSQGCIVSLVVPKTFAITPVVVYPALAPVCESVAPYSIATATVNGAVIAGGTYSGTGVAANGTFNPSTAGAGTHTITYTYTTAGGCTATDSKPILVYAKPSVSFDAPTAAGCLPSNGLVNFTNTSSISDGQTLSYLWNFNDPNATAGNPNTSTAFAPSHNFTDGTYNISLQATSSQGCIVSLVVPKTFAITPVVAYPPLVAVCESATPYSIATATVNGAIITGGTYSGTGVAANGTFNPSIAGAGIRTITYSYTTASGCTASANTTIEVYPRPVASFTNQTDFCLGETTTITPGTAAGVQTWTWDYGNGTQTNLTNNNPINITYAADGNYTVQLITVSNLGCTSIPFTGNIIVRPIPVAQFTAPEKICLPGAAPFVNTSTVADNSALTYIWNFGDGSGSSTEKNPSYTYAGAGSYSVALAAISAFGCENISAPQIVDDFYEKPVAAFTVSPEELCEGTDIIFTDASNPAALISSWRWNFGDGSGVVTSASPTKRFERPGTFNTTLSVTDVAGCTSLPFTKTVTVHLQPKIDAGRSFVVPQGTVVQFEATANSTSLALSWSNASTLSNPSVLRPTLRANEDATYILTAVGEYNCSATDILTVKILKPVNVPNAFSPNGDNINDRWLIHNLADYPGCSVSVFNRYGQEVLFTNGYGIPWDGKLKGKDLPMGTYYYIIKLENGFSPVTGSITILR